MTTIKEQCAELVERYAELETAQKEADQSEAIVEYKRLRKERTAEKKEIKVALMQLVATDAPVDEVVVGNRIVVRESKATVTHTRDSIKAFLGEGYAEYEDENKDIEDSLRIKRVPRENPQKRTRV